MDCTQKGVSQKSVGNRVGMDHSPTAWGEELHSAKRIATHELKGHEQPPQHRDDHIGEGRVEIPADQPFLDVTGRTAKRLLELSDGEDEFILPVTQEELAGMVGASRERVNKAIASFIRLGWIDQHDRRYTIKLRDRLELRSR